MRSVADVIVRGLREAGVSTLFGIPGGGSNLDVIDAAGRAGLRFVLTATETGAALAALAQTEVTGHPGACLTTLGPGVSSVANGVACAYLDRAPVLVLTDRYPASADGASHQRLDHRALLAPVTKWSVTISTRHAERVMRDALRLATTGQPGPVHIDVLSGEAAGPFEESPRGGGDALESRIARWELPGGKRRPMLLVGLGARRAGDADAIRSFCTRHRVPAMVTYKANGVVRDDDPCFAGVYTNAALEQPLLDQADLLIGVGLDPVELLPRRWPNRQPVVYIGPWRVDEQHVPWTAQFVANTGDALDHLSARLSASDWDLDAVHRAVATQRDRLRSAGSTFTPDRVVRAAAAAAGNARVTVDAGAHMFAATMLWPVARPNDMLISNGLSTMGFALPAAIGAAIADRTRPVVALTGDGGLLMCAGELLTAVRERLRIVTVVFADASLSLIAIKQRQRQLASNGVALGDVAWCALAESFGVHAACAANESELEGALSRALGHDGPSLIEARVDPAPYADMLRAVRG